MIITHLCAARALPFTASKASKLKSEIWTKWPMIPAASMAKAAEALTLYALIDVFI